MPSMKDVARLAGVSVSTVSRVINGTIPVDEDTRERVNAAISAIDFKPNLLARGLRLKSGNLIGLVVPEMSLSTFTPMIRYAEEGAEENGYDLILGSTDNDPEREARFIEALIRRNIDGIIFSRVSDRSRVMRLIERSNVPIVIIDRYSGREDIPCVVLDNYRAGVIAAEHLLSRGHGTFACITGPLDIALSRERAAGFRDTIRQHGGRIDDASMFEGDFSFEAGTQAVRRFRETGARFTALWAQNDYMAIGALNELRRRGTRIPGDVSIVGLDNIEASWMIDPPLTTIAQPFRQMCRTAVDLIVKMNRKEPAGETRTVVMPELIVRATTGCPGSREEP